MIQRFQSLWLLLAAIFAFFTFKLPFYSGSRIIKGIKQPDVRLDATSQILILILTGIVILLCLVALFLYKNRRRQLTLTIINIILSIILLTLYFLQMQKFETGIISLSCLFVLAIPIFLVLAARGIWKDEKLIKSLDRLR
jgi:heme/copper-type cytochrome/quinol oxidase subunit 3